MAYGGELYKSGPNAGVKGPCHVGPPISAPKPGDRGTGIARGAVSKGVKLPGPATPMPKLK